MTDGTMTQAPTLRAGVAHHLEATRAGASSRDSTRNHLLLQAGGWLVFGIAMMIGSLDIMPWDEVLATESVYVVVGFALALLLARAYDVLDVRHDPFARMLVICIVGSSLAGMLWNAAFYFHRHYGAATLHSLIIGAPSPMSFKREWILDGALEHCVLPMFGWSLVHLGFQYTAALREERETALRAMAAARDAQLRMLAYQLNPHFLFNTLNSIRALVNEDRQRARDMVTALSGYLRYALVERPLHVALLEEEVASVRGYLSIEKVRFEERLDVRMEVDPATLQCEVPAFLLNPLVENAVRHGAGGTADAPLVVRVAAQLLEPERLLLVVENTGRWAGPRAGDETRPGGVGLANVRARLEALHPGNHRLDIDEHDGCVRVVVELPARRHTAVAS